MPRKVTPSGVPNVTVKVSPSTESEPKSEDKSEDPTLTEEQRIADDAIEQSTAGAISRAIAWVWRVGNDGTKAYVGSVAPDLVTNEFLLENCGGGTYDVDYRRPRKRGGTEQATSRRFVVDPKIPPKIPPWAQVPVTPTGTAPDAAARNGIGPSVVEAGILSMLQQQQQIFQQQQAVLTAGLEQSRVHSQMQMELLRASLNKPEPPPPPPPKEDRTVETIAAIVTPIVTSVTGIITAVISRPQPDALGQFAAVATALKPPPAPLADATQLGSLIAALNGLADLKDKIGGGNGTGVIDTGNPILDTVRDVARAIPEVASAAKVAMQQRQAGGAPSETRPEPAPGALTPGQDRRALLAPQPGEPMGPPKPAAPPATTDANPAATDVPALNGAQSEEDMLRTFLSPISAEVIQLAKANRDPKRIAQSFLDLHERYLDQIAWWVEQPNCVQNFLRDFPEWTETPALKTWLEEFIQTIDQETHEAPHA